MLPKDIVSVHSTMMMTSSNLTLLLLTLVVFATGGHAFSASPPPGSTITPQADKAIAIYGDKFSFLPPGDDERAGKVLKDVTELQTRACFEVLAENYGADNALSMVNSLPICLAYKKEYFGPSLDAFGEKFGKEAALEMVVRNPNLLSVNPKAAALADDSAMGFSYIVAFTRPLGPVLLVLLLALLLAVPIEGLTGFSIREALFP